MIYRTALVLALVAGLSACDDYEDDSSSMGGGGAPAVGNEYDLSAFQGARAGQAEGGITALGYAPMRSEGLTTWWRNGSTGACARITTADGRYSEVRMVSPGEC